LVDRVQTLVDEIKPALATINSAVEIIDTQLSTFDLKDASAAIVDQLHQLRDTIKSLDLTLLPDAALSALHDGAQFLKNLDIAGTVNPPLSEALEQVDPTSQLETVSATLSVAVGQLKAIDPASVVKQLDQPVDELLKALSEFGPDKLRSLLDAAIRPVEEALKDIDFSSALAPVTRVYADLFARVDAVLNPELIFGPLNELVQPVVNVIDAIQPSRLLEFATSQAGPMADAVGSSAQPPAVITGGSAVLDGLPETPELNHDLFGFRPGDMLVPVIDLYRQFMEVIEGLTDDVLGQAADLFRDLFSVRLQALFPSAVQLEMSSSIELVTAEFDPGLVNRRLLESAKLFQTFVTTFRAKSVGVGPADATVTLRIGSLLSQLDPFLLAPAPSQSEAVVAACAQVQGRLNLDGLQNAASHLLAVRSTLPPFLGSAEVTVASFLKFLKDLDPAPVRVAINEAFDRIGVRIVALQKPLVTGVGDLMNLAEEFLLPISPAALVELANRLHQAVKEQLLAFHPNTFKDEVTLIFDIVKAQLSVFDPSIIVDELNKQRELLIKSLHDFIAQLQPDPAQFIALQQNLAGLRPSEILKPAIEVLKPVTELLEKIDIKIVLEPLIEAIARVREQVPDVVAEIEAALDEVLDAIPEGGLSRVSGSVSVAVG